MSHSEPVQSPRPWNLSRSRRYWLAVLVPLYAVWLVVHWQSYALVNGTIAGVGPVLVILWAGIRQKDWRFIAIALAYAILPAALFYRLFTP
jgi:hypothetical protein